MNTGIKESFIRSIAEAAVEDWQQRKICLPSVTIALAVEGTDFGQNAEYQEKRCLFPRRYDGIGNGQTIRDAVRSHSSYLAVWREKGQQNPNWVKLLGQKHYILAVQHLQEAEYPYCQEKNFETRIVELIENYGLSVYDE